MRTLSVFPSLIAWSELAPLLIRVCLGSVFLVWAYQVFKKRASSPQIKAVGVVQFIVGILLIVGLWTQVAALIAVIGLGIRLARKIQTRQFLTDGVNYYLILLVLAISLLVTGPGFFGFDFAGGL